VLKAEGSPQTRRWDGQQRGVMVGIDPQEGTQSYRAIGEDAIRIIERMADFGKIRLIRRAGAGVQPRLIRLTCWEHEVATQAGKHGNARAPIRLSHYGKCVDCGVNAETL
jgi:hypothetical protein